MKKIKIYAICVITFLAVIFDGYVVLGEMNAFCKDAYNTPPSLKLQKFDLPSKQKSTHKNEIINI